MCHGRLIAFRWYLPVSIPYLLHRTPCLLLLRGGSYMCTSAFPQVPPRRFFDSSLCLRLFRLLLSSVSSFHYPFWILRFVYGVFSPYRINRPLLVAAGLDLFISSAVGLSSSSSSIILDSSALRFFAFSFSTSDVLALRISSALLFTCDFFAYSFTLAGCDFCFFQSDLLLPANLPRLDGSCSRCLFFRFTFSFLLCLSV